ncbi:hypothetical protein [Streptomyces sp. NPDC051286]
MVRKKNKARKRFMATKKPTEQRTKDQQPYADTIWHAFMRAVVTDGRR